MHLNCKIILFSPVYSHSPNDLDGETPRNVFADEWTGSPFHRATQLGPNSARRGNPMKSKPQILVTVLFTAAVAITTIGIIRSQATELSAEAAHRSDSTVSVKQKSLTKIQDRDASDGEFVMHEWGTFTTFSGSDGVFLDFRPLAAEHSDLPSYVMDRANNSGVSLFAKRRLFGRVRMETPVIYFYTDRVRSVNVRVEFPAGLLTEFYPPVQSMTPAFDAKIAYGEGEPIGKSSLDWGTVNLIPQNALVPGIKDPSVRTQIANTIMNASVPHGANEQHYAQARATDSALVHVSNGNADAFFGQFGQQDHLEKFLFYRGVGSFDLPVEVFFQNDQPVFANHGTDSVASVIMIESDNGALRAIKIDRVVAGDSIKFAATQSVTLQELFKIVSQSLIDEGLFEKEATAMVRTWQQSWFTEDGRRVLYIVPENLTEQLLPLQITPAPKENLRVLVGRMEIMSPSDEAALTSLVRQSIKRRQEFLQSNAAKPKTNQAYPVPAEIKEWGRMTEPALIRISKSADNVEVQQEAKKLLETIRAK